jgi:hypothetical protein
MSLANTVTALLEKYGVDVTLQKRSASAYSPTSDTIAATNTAETARCVVVRKSEQRTGELDSRNVSTVALFFGPSPQISIGDRFTLDGKSHAIETAEQLAVSGVTVGYRVTATR